MFREILWYLLHRCYVNYFQQRGHLIGWRTGKLVARFVTLARDFSVCFVYVEADMVMCFGPIDGCMIPLMQYSTWKAISSLRDLDRWLVYSVCSGCLARWALGYTCSSAVFDFGKGREAPQHTRRSLWSVIFRGFLTSKNCERWWANECSLWSVIFRESLTSNGCEVSKWVSRVQSVYISLEHLNASCIRSSSVYRAVSMHGESRPNTSTSNLYILRHCRQQFCHYLDFASSPIILTSLRHQSVNCLSYLNSGISRLYIANSPELSATILY